MVAVNYVGEELWSYFNAPWEKRVDLAWQLMEIAEQLTNNDFEFALYLLDVSFDNFASFLHLAIQACLHLFFSTRVMS